MIRYFRPIACLLSLANVCFLVDYMIVTGKAPVENSPVLAIIVGASLVPIYWWFRSRDKEKENRTRR
jgi:hypothetical protein